MESMLVLPSAFEVFMANATIYLNFDKLFVTLVLWRWTAIDTLGKQTWFTIFAIELRQFMMQVLNALSSLKSVTSYFCIAEFFKHEKCISKVLNSNGWNCEAHYKMVKQTNGLKSCQHWDDFRKCAHASVTNECGAIVANLSDVLFHTQFSYFTKYSSCDLPGSNHTKCWYDSLLERSSGITTTTTTTTVKSVLSNTAQESKPKYAWTRAHNEHTTFVSEQTNQHLTDESTEWNKMYTTGSSHSSVRKTESSFGNDESFIVEHNSIHHEEKHSETDDHDSDHEEKVDNESYHEKKKLTQRKQMHLSEPAHSTVPSVSTELFQNDVDPKTNETAVQHKTSAQQINKPLLVEREGKSMSNDSSPMVTESSRIETINLASASHGHVQEGNGASGYMNSLVAIMLPFLVLFILSV